MEKEKLYTLLLILLLTTNLVIVSFLFKFSNDLDSVRTSVYETATKLGVTLENLQK